MSLSWTIKSFICHQRIENYLLLSQSFKAHRSQNCTVPHNLFALFLAPANACFNGGEKIKRIQLTVLVVSTLILQEKFFRFYFNLPRFQQFLAVYIITLRRVIWLPRRQATAALPLISWTPSAPLWRRLPILTGKQGNLSEEVLESNLLDGSGLDWKKWEGQSSTHNIYLYTLSFLAVMLTNFPKSHHLKHFKTRFFKKIIFY